MIGVIINKFRGDVALLMPGIKQIEDLTNVPVLGVLPWLDVDLEDEDGVALQVGKYDGKTEEVLDIVVVQLPHIANFTDFNALAAQPDVRLRYESDPLLVGEPDLLIILAAKTPSVICCGCVRKEWIKPFSPAMHRVHRLPGSAAAIRSSVNIFMMMSNPDYPICQDWGCSISPPASHRKKIPPRPPEPCAAHCRDLVSLSG